MPTCWCYLRVSSRKKNGKSRQSTGSQKTSIRRFCKANGIRSPKWVEDYQSGRQDDRDGLQTILNDAAPGDTLLIWKLDRLGRSMIDTVRNLQVLIGRKVKIIITSNGMTFDNDDAMSTFLMQLFSALAELESNTIGERVKASIEHRRANGQHVGAKPKQALRNKVKRWRESGVPVTTIAQRLGKSRQAVYGLIHRMVD